MNALAVENLCVYHRDTCLLGPVSFALQKGECLVIMGETGAGKSLILQAILGILPTGLQAFGEVYLQGNIFDPAQNPAHSKLWGKAISILPQEAWRALDPLMQSWRQVFHSYKQVAEMSSLASKQKTGAELQALGLEQQESRLVSQVSGGMAQRIAFLAARAGGAQVFLADEPTKGLDFARQAQMTKLLQQVQEAGGCLVSVTHDASVAEALGGNLIILKHGKIVEQGYCHRVFAAPQHNYTKQILGANPKNWHTSASSLNTQKLVLEASNIALKRGGKTLFEDCTIKLHQGEKLAICGPSGVGKTSLLDCLTNLLKPQQGSIRLHTTSTYPMQKLYQDPQAAFPPFVLIKTILQDTAKLHNCPWRQVLDYFRELHLEPGLMERLPDAVSGGELQRISLVRALLAKPQILLADEPTSRLDPITQKQTLGFLQKLIHKNAISTILVTHNIPLAEKWADCCIHIKTQDNFEW